MDFKSFYRLFRPRIVIVLLLFWIVLTGKITVEYLITGFLLSLLITIFWGDYLLPPAPGKTLLIHPGLIIVLFKYFFSFIKDLVVASIQVTRIVLSRNLPIEPGFIEYDLKLKETIPRVLLANSITLTPGTLTIYLAREHIVVHALTKKAACDVVDWHIQDYLLKIEGVEE